MTRRTTGDARRAAAFGTAIVGLALLAGGCGSDVIGVPYPGAGGGSTEFHMMWRMTSGGFDKIDLLLMVDNSRSMADKQLILAAAVPDLIQGLVNPACIDAEGALSAQQPAGPFDPCPAGTRRRFPPITDVHIGVITSSIGGHASDACPDSETLACPAGATNTSNNDHGQLVSRSDPCFGGAVPTYQGQGFLAWDPVGKASPPGEPNVGAIAVDPSTGAVSTVAPGLVPALKDLVIGVGQIGCGYEAQMEAWYRFLVDPTPYQSIAVQGGKATPMGIDQVLLAQRAEFLRPSSLLSIVALTDENDCSIKEYGQFYFAAQQRDPSNPNKNFYLPKARSECATNPNDACCRSCGQDQTGCPADPNCNGTSLDAKTDDVNLRCWDQKRRFGIDFLYPIDRYVTALTNPLVPDVNGELVQNPIFTDLNPGDADSYVRDSSMVFLTYITGVPWQDIARDPADAGKGFKNASEMALPDAQGHTTWDVVLGDPANFVPPLDPLMIESTSPRFGTNPITGDPIAPTTAPSGANPINGHEYTPNTEMGVQKWPDDLQYACIFDIPQPRDCSDPNLTACDCRDPLNDNPLCEPDPNKVGNPRTLQVRAKAYPGVRQLQLLKEIGMQGIPASICPAQLSDINAPSYGYRPAIAAVIDRLGAAVEGGCLPKQLQVDASGQVPCAIVEAHATGKDLDAEACESFCDGFSGRIGLTGSHAPLRAMVLADPGVQQFGADCVCEIPQLGGAPGCGNIQSELAACQCDPSPAPSFGGKSVDGFCYVDAAQGVGNPAVVQSCPAGQERALRFVGTGAPMPGTVVMLVCAE